MSRWTIIKRMAFSVITNIMEIEDVNFLKMTNSVIAEMGHVMVSPEWTVEGNRAVSEIPVLLLIDQ